MSVDNGTKKIYLSSVAKKLPLSHRQKKTYLRDISESVGVYCLEHPDASLDDLYEAFGRPEEIADSFALEQTGEGLVSLRQKQRRMYKACLLLLCVVITASAVGLFLFYQVSRNSGFYYDEKLTINQTEPLEYDKSIPLELNMADVDDGNIRFVNAKKTNATKIISCYDEKDNLLWTTSITKDFLYPYSAQLAGVLKVNEYNKEPDIAVDILNKDYMVEIKDVINSYQSVQVIFRVSYQNKTEEKVVLFLCDENGNIQ